MVLEVAPPVAKLTGDLGTTLQSLREELLPLNSFKHTAQCLGVSTKYLRKKVAEGELDVVVLSPTAHRLVKEGILRFVERRLHAGADIEAHDEEAV